MIFLQSKDITPSQVECVLVLQLELTLYKCDRMSGEDQWKDRLGDGIEIDESLLFDDNDGSGSASQGHVVVNLSQAKYQFTICILRYKMCCEAGFVSSFFVNSSSLPWQYGTRAGGTLMR